MTNHFDNFKSQLTFENSSDDLEKELNFHQKVSSFLYLAKYRSIRNIRPQISAYQPRVIFRWQKP